MLLGIVTGLTAEARIARALSDTEAGGGTPFGAEIAAEKLVARGATALLSFGLAGGLDPALKPGDIVVPTAVIEHGVVAHTDPALSTLIGGWFGGFLFAAERIVADPQAKRRLRANTGASAVDLESGAVARVAARHEIPFAVLRAICDHANRTLPPAALIALNAKGTVGLGAVLGSVMRHPSQIGGMFAVGRDAAAARRALIRRVSSLVDKGGLLVL